MTTHKTTTEKYKPGRANDCDCVTQKPKQKRFKGIPQGVKNTTRFMIGKRSREIHIFMYEKEAHIFSFVFFFLEIYYKNRIQ